MKVTYFDVIEVTRDSIYRGETGKIVDNLLVDCVSEHGLDNLPEDDDHLSPQPDVPVRQVKHLVQQPQGDPQGDVVIMLQPGANLVMGEYSSEC